MTTEPINKQDQSWTIVLDRVGLAVAIVVGLGLAVGFLAFDVRPLDADTFWAAGHSQPMYGAIWGVDDAYYVYPPPLAQVVALLPWPVFLMAWSLLLWVAFWVATRQWFLPVLLLGVGSIATFGFTFPLANPVLLTGVGNPQVIVAAVCVVGLRYPATWCVVLLTKVAPGIGLLWFVVRREWLNFGVAFLATAIVAALSVVAGIGAWGDFVRFATANAATTSPEPTVPVPFIIRAAMSSVLIAWGAHTDRAWTIPIGVGWSAIALYEWSYLTVWMAALPLAGISSHSFQAINATPWARRHGPRRGR